MATLHSYVRFDDTAFDLNRIFRTAVSREFLEDVRNPDIFPNPLEDVLRLGLSDGRRFEVAGSDFSFDASGALVGGWVTRLAYLQHAPAGYPLPWIDVWELGGIGLNAAAVYRAMSSTATDDDRDLLARALGGSDSFLLSNGIDHIARGYAGDDVFFGGDGADRLEGGPGNDDFSGGLGVDTLIGGPGNDTYRLENERGDVVVERPGEGIDRVRSGFDHTLAPDVERLDMIGPAIVGNGNAGANTIHGNEQPNRIDGRSGDDSLHGHGGDDEVRGGTGNDTIDATVGRDTVYGGAGNDVYTVQTSDLVVEYEDEGIDTVRVCQTYSLGFNLENLRMLTGASIDGTGNFLDNVLTGNAGANRLAGSGGDDTLDGRLGNDRLAGGFGADTFRFGTAPNAATNMDRLEDFESADDRLQFCDEVFTALGAPGALAAAAFRLGTAALDASDRIVYDRATGALRYDPDGSGAQAATLVAQLGAGTLLTLGDLFVV